MRNVNNSTDVCQIWLSIWSFYPRKQILLHFALKTQFHTEKCYVYTTQFNTSISMLVVVSIACCSLRNMEATVAPNFASVPILLRFLWHGERTGVWTLRCIVVPCFDLAGTVWFSTVLFDGAPSFSPLVICQVFCTFVRPTIISARRCDSKAFQASGF